jgi:hypothetical protein
MEKYSEAILLTDSRLPPPHTGGAQVGEGRESFVPNTSSLPGNMGRI